MTRPVETFRIKTEGHPHRCEICHQDDLFDPLSGHCGRCSGLIFVLPAQSAATRPDEFNLETWDKVVLVVTSLLALPGAVGVLLFLIHSIVSLNPFSVFLGLATTVFAVYGGWLLFWYFHLGEVEADSPRRLWLGRVTVGYNLLAILGGFGSGMIWANGKFLSHPLFLLWLAWTVSMVFYGQSLIQRELDRHGSAR